MRLNGVLPSCVAFRPSGVLGVLLLCILVALTGCSSKNITSKGPFVLQEPSKGYPSVPSSSGQKTGTVYLPSDDGRPLTKAEQEAFLSEGEIDRNLPQEELGDVLLHFKYLVHKDRYTVEKNLERAQLYIAARTGVCRVYRERIQPDGDFEQRGRGNVAIHFEHGQALRHGAGLVDG